MTAPTGGVLTGRASHRAIAGPRPRPVCGRPHDVRPAPAAITRPHRTRAKAF